MTEIKATYCIVTPMFIGDADQQPTSIRPPSIKGALRFWWRALNWGRIRCKEGVNNDQQALKQLHKEEAALFGHAAAIGKPYGQSKCILQVSFKPTKKLEKTWPAGNSGSRYLGLGLLGNRKAFSEGDIFELRIRFKPRTDNSQVEQVKQTLMAWGSLGGLGGRGSRRGFGSVAIEKLDDNSVKYMKEKNYLDSLGGLFGRTCPATETPPYTSLTKGACFEIVAEGEDARQVHSEMGEKYRTYRRTLETNKRIPFGLPLASVDTARRRASPLFFHVHPVGEKYLGIVLFVPAKFHPEYTNTSYEVIKECIKKMKVVQ